MEQIARAMPIAVIPMSASSMYAAFLNTHRANTMPSAHQGSARIQDALGAVLETLAPKVTTA